MTSVMDVAGTVRQTLGGGVLREVALEPPLKYTVVKSCPLVTGFFLCISVSSRCGEANLVCVYSFLNALQLCREQSKHVYVCKRTTAVMRKLFRPHSHSPDFCPVDLNSIRMSSWQASLLCSGSLSKRLLIFIIQIHVKFESLVCHFVEVVGKG